MDFYKRALYELAGSMAPGVRRAIEKTIIDAYQSAAAHGVTDAEDVVTEWDELGAILSSDHHLREMALGELRSKIGAALKGLAYADELALWLSCPAAAAAAGRPILEITGQQSRYGVVAVGDVLQGAFPAFSSIGVALYPTQLANVGNTPIFALETPNRTKATKAAVAKFPKTP